ncbi:glycosyltransferase [Bifidobacterium phasiani]|uniref:Glycosyltransferase n=1 Tax=Bifidobacterium phasiani TaxID=2834431 RepID=A0ABS6W7X4_9BIFI|nr:glycosyltransferase [Bifidobacterium phasiani]MBW3082603.1 glycosyltransferase [Bifidobacterium phasiani]
MPDHRYSVLLPVYGKDSPAYLRIAIDSMLAQTLPPDEILIAVDGPIGSNLMTVINQYRVAQPDLFSLYQAPNQGGLGALLRKAVPLCRNTYIARMDADDYSSPERLSKQFAILDQRDDVDIVGCNVDEFMDDVTEPVSHVVLPELPADALRFAKRRCPMRHPALLYRKDDVLAAGNYRPLYTFEDYDLIVRMLHRGLRLYNVQEPLVSMRVSPDFYARRGGPRFVACMVRTKWRFLVMGFSSLPDFLVSCLGQTFVGLMPGSFRAWFYKTFLRKEIIG